MSRLLLGRSVWIASLAVMVVAVSAACQPESVALEPLADYTFSDLTPHQAVGFDLPEGQDAKLLVRVEGYEVAFESSVVARSGETLSVARLPYLRAGPVFHVIESQAADGRAKVLIQPTNLSQNSKLTTNVYELPENSGQHFARIDAYKAYEAATQSTEDESPDIWRARLALLRTAASGFERAGAFEEQLWAEYLEGHVRYFPLAQYGKAANMARSVQKQAARRGQSLIELMATQLEGQALLERGEGDSPEIAQEKAGRAQQVLQRAADLAEALGYRYEQAWALNSRGIGYFYQDLYAEAEQQYRQALAIAKALEDGGLQKQLRGNLALVRERQGDLPGALAMLLEIKAQLQPGGAKSDLAHNWSELGRLYQGVYLFPQAIEAQHRALELWRDLNSAEGEARSGMALAYAYQAIGNPEMARSVLTEAMKAAEAARYGRGLRDGFGLLANIHRGQGRYERMAEARERQADYLASEANQARLRYDQAVDALARFSAEPAKAEQLFAEAERLAKAAGDAGIELRARLQGCAIAPQAAAEFCAAPERQSALNSWLSGAPPSQAFEARFLLARILANAGRLQPAWTMLDELIDDIQLYRSALPGVLGAWYWESRVRVFDHYMQLALRPSESGQPRPMPSLLAFNRLLNTSLHGGPLAPTGADPSRSRAIDEVRALLARLEQGDAARRQEIRQAIDRKLMALGSGSKATRPALEPKALEVWLGSMPPDSALLAYYLTNDASWAWVAGRGGVRIYRLPDSAAIERALARVHSGVRMVGNDRREDDLRHAGDLLLAPLARELPETVYLLAAGPLAGFPFEALRHDGRYFAQDHHVVNVLSLDALGRLRRPAGNAMAWQEVLLLGGPSARNAGLTGLPSAAREIDGLAVLLAGKSITRNSSEGLRPDWIHGPAYGSADVIHLASHAQVNLEYPELSRLMLSADAGPAAYLTPLDLRRVPIKADLVVLSACETTGVNAFSFDSNLGFVPAFLHSGARAVVASLWPVADAFTAEFMLGFYEAMLQGAHAPQALAQVKRRYIADPADRRDLSWPSFQIYLN